MDPTQHTNTIGLRLHCGVMRSALGQDSTVAITLAAVTEEATHNLVRTYKAMTTELFHSILPSKNKTQSTTNEAPSLARTRESTTEFYTAQLSPHRVVTGRGETWSCPRPLM